MSIHATLAELERGHLDAALCTVVAISGSTPRKPGAKMIVIDNNEDFGRIIGTIGGGAIEHHIRQCAIRALRRRHHELVTTSLRNELGMCCGGEMTVFIEPVVKRSSLICFGAGHIAQALCPLAVKLGFLVSVVDERKDLLDHEAFAQLEHRFSDPSLFSCSDMPFGDATFVVVATHAHDLDQQIVENVLKQRYRFLALVGSERKAAMTKKRLRAKNFAENDIARVVCPAGLAINASTPEEIALSIVAQMIQVKNNASSWRLDCSGG